MDLEQKIRELPTRPGVYLYKDADGVVIYVGKAKNLRSRVRSYLLAASQAHAKTGSLMREAVDLDFILVDNEHEALALENNLIKQKKPRFNILLRDDKTYHYVKLTMADRHPKVFVTRRLRKDGAAYYGPFFPGNLAYRIAELLHRSFLLPSCKVDLGRYHPRPCLQYYIKRCLGPCVEGLTTPQQYAESVRDAQMFLEGRGAELGRAIEARMQAAASAELYELAAKYRDLLVTVDQLQEKQRMASAEDDDADLFGYHYEKGMLAVNLFHVRSGKIVDRREFFWEDVAELEISEDEESPGLREARETREFEPGAFFASLLKQLYLEQPYVPRHIYTPVDFGDRAALATALSRRGRQVEIAVPLRGDKRSLLDLAGTNAKQSYDQRFRVLKPSEQAIAEALEDALMLPETPTRIECFDISHIQGAETVASMVVWERGGMKKSDYRKFQIKTVSGVDDFASMREVILRRYKRLTEEDKPLPSLILVDGGLGQLHAAASALQELGLTTQPLASIAKREELIYVHGGLHGSEEEPVVLDRRSPVLHLVQRIRDESHRFAISYHRKRREMRDRSSELLDVAGVGSRTRIRLVEHFGSIRAVQAASVEALTAVVPRPTAERIFAHFHPGGEAHTIAPSVELPVAEAAVLPVLPN